MASSHVNVQSPDSDAEYLALEEQLQNLYRKPLEACLFIKRGYDCLDKYVQIDETAAEKTETFVSIKKQVAEYDKVITIIVIVKLNTVLP